MASTVSKKREKNSLNRSRKAAKAALAQRPFHQRRRYCFLYALVLFILCGILIALPSALKSDFASEDFIVLGGKILALFIGVLVTTLLLRSLSPGILNDNRRTLMLCTITLLSCLSGWGLLYINDSFFDVPNSLTTFMIPFVLAPLIATLLDSSIAGIACGLWSALFMTIIAISSSTGRATEALIIFGGGILSTMIASSMAINVRRRSQVLKIAIFASFAQIIPAATTAAITLKITQDPMLLVQQTGVAVIGGGVIGIIVLLILPFLERIFQRTTNITLLEFSDLGHPLLQRLALEAPGTYHHSLVVATLAQSAADTIGANSLLARVCCYFHDIGKLTKPDFFTENQHRCDNPHDELSPSMSTLIITSHVKEGLCLAKLNKLPGPIVDVIREHHGTSVIAFFHHKAREIQRERERSGDGNGERIDEGIFRYGGPIPASRESSIISLADSVEAASRSLDKQSPGQIEGLVNDITNKKFQDGQLSNSSLSLAELSAVKRSFVFTLTNMLHARVAYPKDDNRDSEQPAQDTAESSGN